MNRKISRVAAAAASAFMMFAGFAVTPAYPEADPAAASAEGYDPEIRAASDEAEKAVALFEIPPGFEIRPWAAEPMLANPVALYIDHKGRVYVTESFRHHAGVSDMRKHTKWLEDDLAARTVADRLAAMKKNLGEDFELYDDHHERIRLIEDTDGDGKADRAVVYADGFNDPLDGIAAGLLYDRGDIYYANIPHLWKLRDTDGDGTADERESLSYGYGVHISLLGHDLHGLRKGPDGRIWFSMGDRGFHVEHEGNVFPYPDTGAVLRCDPDGSGLEVVHSGLRNPQELVFDDFGNLFTGDNNSDGGDKARWVWIVEGGTSGWHIGYQWIREPVARGPWNRERLWEPHFAGQAAYIVPALANISSGPSGLTYNPGTGLSAKYDRHFFLCDFRGNARGSIIHSFAVEPRGASFKLTDAAEFTKGLLATDLDFGPDGALYISDWIQGWDQPKAGRVYRMSETEAISAPEVERTRVLLASDFSGRETSELARLLGHRDQRVRYEAQWTLADRVPEALGVFTEAARAGGNRMARLHGIWGLWQIGRASGMGMAPLIGLLADEDAEVRAQAARVLGELGTANAAGGLTALLHDVNGRVRFFSAIALGGGGGREAVGPLTELLRRNADSDPYIRHAAVQGLHKIGADELLLPFADDDSAAVRLGVVLALRKSGRPEIAWFLEDSDPLVVTEAARAINDVPIEEAVPALAEALGRVDALAAAFDSSPADINDFALRALNANFRVGREADAERVARAAMSPKLHADARIEAVTTLGMWGEPPNMSRVINEWRPLGERPAGFVPGVVRPRIAALLGDTPDGVAVAAAGLAVGLGITEAGGALFTLLQDTGRDRTVRIAALEALAKLEDPRLTDAVALARTDEDARVRSAGLREFARLNPAEAVGILNQVLDGDSIPEMKGAFEALAEMAKPEAAAVIGEWVGRLREGTVPPEVQLELVLAAESYKSENIALPLFSWKMSFPKEDTVGAWQPALAGGDAERGKQIFFTNAEATCQRCHAVNGEGGGEVGPDLTGIGAKRDRRYILESIIKPNAQIAEGYENVTLVMKDGTEHEGRVVKESETEITLEKPVVEEGEEFVEEDAEEADGAADESASAGSEPKSDDAVRLAHGEAGKGEGEKEESEPAPQKFETVVVAKAEVAERRRNLSSMPEGIPDLITRGDIRDLVEYLAGLK